MDDSVYSNCIPLIAPFLAKAVWAAEPILNVANAMVWTKVTRAVYIVLDDKRDVAYVGSVDRENGGINARAREHMSDPRKTIFFELMILPINPAIDEVNVRTLERLVGKRLRPYASVRLPGG